MEIFVVRHGQTDYNIEGRFQGQLDIPLNNTGIEQAKQTAEKFKNEHIDLIISSTLQRTRQTAEYINKNVNAEIIFDERIMERYLGDIEGGKNRDDWNIEMMLDYDKNYDKENIETIQDFFKRIYNFLDDIKEKYKDKRIILVTHGIVSIAIECYVNGMPKNRTFDGLEPLALKNCEIRKYSIPKEESKYSYITMLSTDEYLIAVLCLAQSIRNTNSKYPISVLITNNISVSTEEMLVNNGLNVIRTDKIKIPVSIQEKNAKGIFSHWTNTFDKLLIFELTQFDKLVYLDSDMYVRKNIDELFEKEHMSATIDRRVGPLINDDWINLTSGTMVIKPKKNVVKEFMKILSEIEDKRESIGDQDILQEYDNEWKNKIELHLDLKYNMFFSYLDYYTHYCNYSFDNIKVIHFILKKKPFLINRNDIPEYLEFLEDRLKLNYEKTQLPIFKECIECGNNDKVKILEEYFDLLENVKSKL